MIERLINDLLAELKMIPGVIRQTRHYNEGTSEVPTTICIRAYFDWEHNDKFARGFMQELKHIQDDAYFLGFSDIKAECREGHEESGRYFCIYFEMYGDSIDRREKSVAMVHYVRDKLYKYLQECKKHMPHKKKEK